MRIQQRPQMIDRQIAQQAIAMLASEGVNIRLDSDDEVVVEVRAKRLDDMLLEFIEQHHPALRQALLAVTTTSCARCGWPVRVRESRQEMECRACGLGVEVEPPKRWD
jgi:hypothetical protein